MSVMRAARPAILAIGRVVFTPEAIEIRGWTLGLCLRACPCHRRPDTADLRLVDDPEGRLGLEKFRPCDCCEPWEPEELVDIVHLLAEFEELAST